MTSFAQDYGALSPSPSSGVLTRLVRNRATLLKSALSVISVLSVVYIFGYIRPLNYDLRKRRSNITGIAQNCVNWEAQICRQERGDAENADCSVIHSALCKISAQVVINGITKALKKIMGSAVEQAIERIGERKGKDEAVKAAVRTMFRRIAEQNGEECREVAWRECEREVKYKLADLAQRDLRGVGMNDMESILLEAFQEVRSGNSVQYAVLRVLSKLETEIGDAATKTIESVYNGEVVEGKELKGEENQQWVKTFLGNFRAP